MMDVIGHDGQERSHRRPGLKLLTGRAMANPVFILATDLPPGEAAMGLYGSSGSESPVRLRNGTRRAPPGSISPASPIRSTDDPGEHHSRVGCSIAASAMGRPLIFVLPVAFDLNIWQRTILGEEVGMRLSARRGRAIHHDTVDPTHPLLVDCFAGQVLEAPGGSAASPAQRRVTRCVADGQGDPRASTLTPTASMRLLWEQTGLEAGGRSASSVIRSLCSSRMPCGAAARTARLAPAASAPMGRRTLRLMPGSCSRTINGNTPRGKWAGGCSNRRGITTWRSSPGSNSVCSVSGRRSGPARRFAVPSAKHQPRQRPPGRGLVRRRLGTGQRGGRPATDRMRRAGDEESAPRLAEILHAGAPAGRALIW